MPFSHVASKAVLEEELEHICLLSIYELLLEVIKQGPTKGWFLLLYMHGITLLILWGAGVRKRGYECDLTDVLKVKTPKDSVVSELNHSFPFLENVYFLEGKS